MIGIDSTYDKLTTYGIRSTLVAIYNKLGLK